MAVWHGDLAPAARHVPGRTSGDRADALRTIFLPWNRHPGVSGEPSDPADPGYGEPDVAELEEPFGDRYGEPDPVSVGADLPAEGEVDPDLVRTFWGLVATVNVGMFAVAIGLMLVGFRGQVRLGGAVLAVGVVTLTVAWVTYRRHRNR